jgi:hypothetical protein
MLEVRLQAEGETPPAAARSGLVKALPMHIEALAADAGKLRARLSKDSQKSSWALPSARMCRTFANGPTAATRTRMSITYARNLQKRTRFWTLSKRVSTRSPEKHGDFRKAYLSAVDHTSNHTEF